MNAMSSTTAAVMTSGAVRPKRVEVRWLESESELYLKRWQHRYHQLVGLENSYHRVNGGHDYDHDYRLCLDLDIDFQGLNGNAPNDSTGSSSLSSAPHRKRSTITTFDHIFWPSDDQKMVKKKGKRVKNNNNSLFTYADTSVANNGKSMCLSLSSGAEEEDGFVVRKRDGVGDGSGDESLENLSFRPIKRIVSNSNNNKIKANNNRNKKEFIFSEKERQFSIDLNKRLELLAKDQALAAGDGDPALKARQPKSRQRDRSRPPRPRPPPIRRQIFKCEHIGCSYQSDRNFNFLRHKRTHRKTKPDDTTTTTDAASTPTPAATPLLAVATTAPSAKPITHSLVVINHNTCNRDVVNTSNTSITSSVSAFIGDDEEENDEVANCSLKTPALDCRQTCDRDEDNVNNNNENICDESHSYHQKMNVCLLMANQ